MSLEIGAFMPLFDGATSWLNADGPPSLSPHPLIVHFWAISCPICKMNMGALRALETEYKPYGLQIIAIHMPRGPFDLDVETVKLAVAELGITEPCAIDNDHALGERFETSGSWPIYFVFDQHHRLKRRAPGKFGLKLCEATVKGLLDTDVPEAVAA